MQEYTEDTALVPQPCVYCGFVASRLSDEDCPANPKNMHPPLRKLLEALKAEAYGQKQWAKVVDLASQALIVLDRKEG